jgi:hypothetical protein
VINKKLLRKERNIKMETREETKTNSSRNNSTQRKAVPHHTRKRMTLKVSQIKNYSWQ